MYLFSCLLVYSFGFGRILNSLSLSSK